MTEPNTINTVGTIIALFILLNCILIFVFRLLSYQMVEYWLGVILLLTSIPLIYLLIASAQHQRPVIYYIQIVLMLVFLCIELVLDYILKINFRSNPWINIPYVMLFFAGTGGMIGIASHSSKVMAIVAVILFFTMAFLAFFQHYRL